MTINMANRLIGSTVTGWDQDSSGYVEGKLVKIFEDSEQASIEISKNTRVLVDISSLIEGIASESTQDSESEIERDVPDFNDNDDNEFELV